MYEKGVNVRAHILNTANNLFYHQGYNQTSFSDIAQAANVPKGNFYHYFKSKEDILNEVITQRHKQLHTLLNKLETQYKQPEERITQFVHSLGANGKGFCQYGCPMGSLITELGKNGSFLQTSASEILLTLHEWLTQQLSLTGMAHCDALLYAKRLLARIQGMILLAQAFSDNTFFRSELTEISHWMKQSIEKQTGIAPASQAS